MAEELEREGSREEFERVLARVPDVEPDPWDRWSTREEEPEEERS
jgi:hypothetical protein